MNNPVLLSLSSSIDLGSVLMVIEGQRSLLACLRISQLMVPEWN